LAQFSPCNKTVIIDYLQTKNKKEEKEPQALNDFLASHTKTISFGSCFRELAAGFLLP
jgi:hypothetical protein